MVTDFRRSFLPSSSVCSKLLWKVCNHLLTETASYLSSFVFLMLTQCCMRSGSWNKRSPWKRSWRRTEGTGENILSLNSALDWGGWSTPNPGRFTPTGKETRHSCYRSLGGSQGWFGWAQKISPSQGFAPQTVQIVASRYTNYAIPAPCEWSCTYCVHETVTVKY
jgi:hypothetical protein